MKKNRRKFREFQTQRHERDRDRDRDRDRALEQFHYRQLFISRAVFIFLGFFVVHSNEQQYSSIMNQNKPRGFSEDGFVIFSFPGLNQLHSWLHLRLISKDATCLLATLRERRKCFFVLSVFHQQPRCWRGVIWLVHYDFWMRAGPQQIFVPFL